MKNLISTIALVLVIMTMAQAQWVQVSNPDPTNANLYSVYFTTPDTGYAVGANGTYLRYYDSAWHTQPLTEQEG